MSSTALESFLARLYTDSASRARFIADPSGEAGRAGLSPTECEALRDYDKAGLQMAAASFGHKRAQHGGHRPSGPFRFLRRLFR